MSRPWEELVGQYGFWGGLDIWNREVEYTKEGLELKTWEQMTWFDPEEFDSPDKPGSGEDMDMRLVGRLQMIRSEIDAPIVPTSGIRTPEHNRNVGGSPRSLHLTGQAADFYCPELDVRELYLCCERYRFGGLGIYPDTDPPVVHADVRESPARRWLCRILKGKRTYTYLW